MRFFALFVCYFLVACASAPPTAVSLSETAGTDPEKMSVPAIVDEPGEAPTYDEHGVPLPLVEWISVNGTAYTPLFQHFDTAISPEAREDAVRTLCHNFTDSETVNSECDEVDVTDIIGMLTMGLVVAMHLEPDSELCMTLSTAVASFRSSEYVIVPLGDFVIARDYLCGCNPATGICTLPDAVTNATGPPTF